MVLDNSLLERGATMLLVVVMRRKGRGVDRERKDKKEGRDRYVILLDLIY